MSDQLENLKPEDVSSGDRLVLIPPELLVRPLRDTVLFQTPFISKGSRIKFVGGSLQQENGRHPRVNVGYRRVPAQFADIPASEDAVEHRLRNGI